MYPGEQLVGEIIPLKIVECDTALRLRALRDFTDSLATDKEGTQLLSKTFFLEKTFNFFFIF